VLHSTVAVIVVASDADLVGAGQRTSAASLLVVAPPLPLRLLPILRGPSWRQWRRLLLVGSSDGDDLEPVSRRRWIIRWLGHHRSDRRRVAAGPLPPFFSAATTNTPNATTHHK